VSYPILYDPTEIDFSHNGVGILSDCVSCNVTEEANGAFELAMTYTMDGLHFEEIVNRSIIKAKADQFRDPQLFRVYSISKPMNGIVTVLAEHISYDLSGIPVKPFSASSSYSALTGLKNNAVVDCPFTFWTDKVTFGNFEISVPSSIRSRLGGVAGSILDVYGGEYEFDNYTVKLHNSRGQNRGVSIRYGKNLTDIKQDQNCSNVATGVYPYWVDSEGAVLVELPERIVNAPGTYNFVKIRTLDLSSAFDAQPTHEQLRQATQKYIEQNKIGVPVVSWSVSFEQLSKSEEYKHLNMLEKVSLFDTVNVEFPALGVSATAKVSKIVYDVISDKIKVATLGSIKANIADTVSNQSNIIQRSPTREDVQKAKMTATDWLKNGKGYKVERVDKDGNTVDTLYMDTPNIEEAVNILRIGQSGIGFSRNGVDGPYYSAWTIDGNFVADFISSGTLNAKNIKVVNLTAQSIVSGILKSSDKDTFFDLDNSTITTESEEGKVEISGGRISVYSMSGKEKIRIIPRRVPLDGGFADIGARVEFLSDEGDEVFGIAIREDDVIFRLPTEDGTSMGWRAMWKYDETIGYYIGTII
jgi:phage minor structural protein